MLRIFAYIWLIIIFVWSFSMLSLNYDRADEARFWALLMWINLLITLNLFLSYPTLSNFQERNSSKIIGSLPAINVIVFFYSLSSGTLAFINYFYLQQTENILGNFHLTIQLVISGIAAVLCLFLALAGFGAETGARNLPTREELTRKLENFRLKRSDSMTETDEKEAINELINYVEYKMPHPASLERSEYESVCGEIIRLVETAPEELESTGKQITSILNKVKFL